MAKEKIIEKLKKLLALQKSATKIGSIEEAANATDKIQRLLLAHNLSLGELDINDKPKAEGHDVNLKNIFDYDTRQGKWIIPLISNVSDFYLCSVVFSDTPGLGVYAVTIIGREDNIAPAIQACLNLVSQIKHLENQAYRTYGENYKRGKFRRSYYMGAVSGLKLAIDKIKKEREKALEIVVEPGVNLPMVMVDKLVRQTQDENDVFKKEAFKNLDQKTIKGPNTGSLPGFMGFKDGIKLKPQTSLGN